MADLSFVRKEMLPEQTPPVTSVGLVGWMRENLFSGWFNSILTLVALVFIYYVFSGVLPWMVAPTWHAASLNEFRDILAELGRDGHFAGACWGVINDRWIQLLFGFYPPELYWRPILALVLLFVALAPILFSEYVPRQMIWVAALYPFAMPWLLWGGAFWVPLLVIAGFVLAALAFRVAAARGGAIGGAIAGVAVAAAWFLVGQGIVNDMIDRTMGSLRLEGQTAVLTERSAELSARIAEIEPELDALTDQVNTRLEEAEAALETGNGSYGALLAEIAPTRDRVARLRTQLGSAKASLSATDTLLRQIESLGEFEAALPDLRNRAADLRAGLPDSVAAVRTENGFEALQTRIREENLDIPEADVQALADTLAAEGEVLTAETAVKKTYADVARIGLEPVESRKFGGFMLSLTIGVVAIGFSLPIGILLALGRQSNLPLLRGICVGFIEFIRGVPLITLLFVASTLLNIFMPPGTDFDIILRVIIMATLFASAYMAEVVRGGLAALPKGQYEGADSLGLDYWQAQRLIIMPQALKISIPGIVSTFIGLFKDTTLVSIIGLLDPLGLSNAIRADSDWNGVVWELYGFIALLFFIACFGMSRYSMWLERKLQTGHR